MDGVTSKQEEHFSDFKAEQEQESQKAVTTTQQDFQSRNENAPALEQKKNSMVETKGTL